MYCLTISVASASSWASEYLNRHPIVLDELLDAPELTSPRIVAAFGHRHAPQSPRYLAALGALWALPAAACQA